jgi:nicotinate-nucleotide pyrophosphorylase
MASVSAKKAAPTKRAAPSPASASDAKRERSSEHLAPLQLEGLLPDLSSYVQLWLSQDVPSFDVQGCVAGSKRVAAHLLQKSPCILAGRPFFDAVFAQLGCSVEWHSAEGSVHSSEGNRHVATVSGPAHAVLKGERTALELVVRCSGIATLASRYAQAAAAAGWKGRVAGTRKVAPGLRLVDKCALLLLPLGRATAASAAAAWPCDG